MKIGHVNIIPISWLSSMRIDHKINKTLMTGGKDKRDIQKLPGKVPPFVGHPLQLLQGGFSVDEVPIIPDIMSGLQ